MDEATPDLITASQARRLLCISKPTLARLIREGALPTTDSPLDMRVKLVRTSDVLALLQFKRQRHPNEVGANEIRPLAETPDTDQETRARNR